ncbi:MAG: hypothetical protein M9930_13955 [Anaerolineae bacterium]|nr:hypothetical protein [Anaerolineae bacterium]
MRNLLMQKRLFGRIMTGGACLAVLIFLIAACSTDPEPIADPPEAAPLLITPVIGEGMVIAADTTIHVEPDGARIGTLGEGERISFMAKSADGNWTLIQASIGSNTLEGWVHSENVDKVTPTPLPPTSTIAAETATATPQPSTDTPTPQPPTNTPTRVPPTNTPTRVPPTNTPTRRPATSTPRPPTATPRPTSPLTLSISLLENIALNDNDARVKIRFNANGGTGVYAYFRDGIQVNGPEYTFDWGTCKGAPMTLKVVDSGGSEVSTPFYVDTPCPDINN